MAAGLVNGTVMESNSQSIMDRAVCLHLEFHKFGVTRKVAADRVGTDADKALLRVSKKILECESYKAITQFDSAARKWIADHSVPSIFSGAGISFVSADPARLAAIDEQIMNWYRWREDLVDRFIAEYEIVAESGRARLASLGDGEDYPSVEKVRRAFYMSHRYIEFAPLGRGRKVSRDLIEREAAKFSADIQNATAEMVGLLREQMADLVDHMLDRLAPTGADEKPRIFRDSMVSNMRDFLAAFNDRNIADDGALEALVTRAGQILEGVTPQNLRERGAVQMRVREGFAQVKERLDGLMIDRPRRAFNFNEE